MLEISECTSIDLWWCVENGKLDRDETAGEERTPCRSVRDFPFAYSPRLVKTRLVHRYEILRVDK
jgi:hypothetical protein